MKKFIILMLLITLPSQSQNVFENIELQGFLSQGYLKSSDNTYFAKNSTDGSFDVNEVGITLTSQINDRLRVGVQLLAYNLGDVGDDKFSLDWAYANYQFSDKFSLLAGKVKLPHGLYNETRDTDFLRSVIFLPQSVYDETKRSIMRAYRGFGIKGKLPIGKTADLDYHFYSGSVDTNSTDPIFQFMTGMANFMELNVSSLNLDTKKMYGGNIILNTALRGLRLGASYLKYDGYFTTPESPSVIGEMHVTDLHVFSLEYEFSRFLIASEYMTMEYDADIYGVSLGAETNLSWYVSLSLFATDKLTVTGTYDVFYADKDDKDGLKYAAMGMPSHMGWRKDSFISIRYDINMNWTLKAEYHDVEGTGLYLSVFNPDGLNKDWNYGALKLSYSF